MSEAETTLPPAEAPRDNPRPVIDRLRKWPFVVGGGVAVLALAGITMGPRLFHHDASDARAEPDQRIAQPRGVRGLATDYTQVAQDAPRDPPAALPPAPGEPEPQTVQQQHMGY